MLHNKTDFPQSQSVQNGTDNAPIVFDRTFTLTDGQLDVKLFGSYFVLDIGASINADDFRPKNTPPDEFFITTLGKRVFVDLEEIRKTSFSKDIVYFLDIPNYQQAVFISAQNAGQTISINNCRGIASSISLFDWNELIKQLNDVTANASDAQVKITALTGRVDIAETNITGNTQDITINAKNIDQRYIVPFGFNWFPTANYNTYFLEQEPSDIIVEANGIIDFLGAVAEPMNFNGSAQIFLRVKNTNAANATETVSVELLVDGNSKGATQAEILPTADFITLNLTMDSIFVQAPNASAQKPTPITLRVSLGVNTIIQVGGFQFPSVMQFQGGGGGGGGDIHIIGDITTLTPESTPEEIEAIFGGTGGFAAFIETLKANPKKLVASAGDGETGLIPIMAMLLQNELSVQFIITIGSTLIGLDVDSYAGLEVSNYGMHRILLDVPVATKTTLGGVKIGNGLTIEGDGTLSLSSGENYSKRLKPDPYFITGGGDIFFQTYMGHKQIGVSWVGKMKKDYSKGDWINVYTGKDIPLDIFFGNEGDILCPTIVYGNSGYGRQIPIFAGTLIFSLYGRYDRCIRLILDYENKTEDFYFCINGVFSNVYAFV